MAVPYQVVITGVGLVSPLGRSVSDFWKGLVNRQSGIRPLTRFDASRFSCRLAAEIDHADLHIAEGPYAHEIKRMDRFIQYALAAADDASVKSGIMSQGEWPPDGSLFIGVGTGGLPHMEAGVLRQESRGPRKVSPYFISSLIPNMAASMIALSHRFRGPQYTIAGACASGNQAIGQAMKAIQNGNLTWALAGGAEAVITPISFSGLQAMRVLSSTSAPDLTPRPFDQHCDGMIVGEGAAIFVLEERTYAEARGATICAALSGYATCSGSLRITLPATDDITSCMALALQDAKLHGSDIDCVYAQAAGLIQGDECEMEALQCIFAKHARQPAISSIKGHIGHCFAASGPLNLVAALEALRTQTVSPTLNFNSTDRKFSNLSVVREGRVKDIRHCLINAFGFGGINASLIVSQYPHNGR